VAEELSTRLEQPIIVENRTGAGNTIAMATVARAEPNGYTILANSATHSLVPVTFSNLPFDTFQDLTPVIPLGNTPLAMVVSPSRGYHSLADFVARAKEARGSMNYSSGGTGSITHLAMEAFRLAAGFEAVHIPFKGAPEALTEVLAGRAEFYFSPLPPALSMLNEGKLRALAVSSSQRAKALPDVLTISEAGYPEATYNFWIGLFLPSKVPSLIADRLYAETGAALQSASVQAKLSRLGADPLPLNRAAFAKLIQDEFLLNTKVVKAAGLKAN
jgi:tripartite-type tricarboxylate transporter receptor subunit TctC